MIIDYKDVHFSFKEKQKQRRRRFFLLLFCAILLMLLFVWIRSLSIRSHMRQAENLLLSNRCTEAQQLLNQRPSLFYRHSRRELQMLAHLQAGEFDAAEAVGKELARKGGNGLVRHHLFFKFFLDYARYRALERFTAFLSPSLDDWGRWYRAIALAALFRLDEARAEAASISAAFKHDQSKEMAALDRSIKLLNAESIPFVTGRNASPLASFDRRSGKVHSLVPGIDLKAFLSDPRQGFRFYALTIDRDIQCFIERIMSGFSGTFLVLDTRDNAIVAAYSKPGGRSKGNTAFTERYEPGSIIKTLTLLAYLEKGSESVFPFSCRAPLELSGKLFYDSMAHGTLRDSSEAMAVSCNLVFARMALNIGYAGLAEVMKKVFFNTGGWQDGPMEFAAGRIDDPPLDDYALASLSIGLRHTSVTTIHAALVASLIANQGRFSPPYLVDHIDNAVSLGVYSHRQSPRQLFEDAAPFRELARSMQAALNHESGTARRARTSGIDAAVKTGTAGDPSHRLDAILIGFFPLAKPEYAFAFRLEGAGRSEIVGAEILRQFFSYFTKEQQ